MQLQLIKAERFGEIKADIYSNGDDMFMTISQLAACLEYASKSGVENILSRNEYLKEPEFSGTHVLWVPNGRDNYSEQRTRVFTEDGIYEVTMLSGQPKAKEFRAWIRKILKALRRGAVPPSNLEAEKIATQKKRAEAMYLNAQTRMYTTIMKTIDNKKLSPIAAEVFGLAALEQVTGKPINYRPEHERTYSATEVGKMFGVSSKRIGKLANANELKTDEYGITVMDKSPYSPKEVSTFRYNQKAVDRIKELLG